jgi:hypothetical protein
MQETYQSIQFEKSPRTDDLEKDPGAPGEIGRRYLPGGDDEAGNLCRVNFSKT